MYEMFSVSTGIQKLEKFKYVVKHSHYLIINFQSVMVTLESKKFANEMKFMTGWFPAQRSILQILFELQ